MNIWNELTDAFGKDFEIEEMAKKYLNTAVVLISPQGKQFVAWYVGYNDGYHQFRDEFGVCVTVSHDTKYQVVCSFPERRLFNHERVALEFVRQPRRQFKRGINKENCMIYSPVKKLFSADNYLWTLKTIRDALFPVYPSCQEAINKLAKQVVLSVAISEKFMLSQSITRAKDIYFLFYCNVVIGFFKSGGFIIKHPLFTQEVLDNLSLFSPYEVKINAN